MNETLRKQSKNGILPWLHLRVKDVHVTTPHQKDLIFIHSINTNAITPLNINSWSHLAMQKYSATCHATRASREKATSQVISANSDEAAIRSHPPPCSIRIYISSQLNTSHFPQPQASSKKGVYVQAPVNETTIGN